MGSGTTDNAHIRIAHIFIIALSHDSANSRPCARVRANNIMKRVSLSASSSVPVDGASGKRTKYLCKFQQDWTKKTR